jgi:imidazolonepropionase-like amidohydrolase
VRDVLEAGLASLEIARNAGVPIGFGTDLLGETHPFQSDEFEIRARVLSPAEIVRSATAVNAEILERSGELGVIAPGARADLLVVDGNPLENLSLLAGDGKHFAAIMKDGSFIVDRLG